MRSMSWRKVTGWSGLAFVIVFLVSELPLADTPALDAPAADIRQWFEANATQIAVTMWGVALAVGLLFLLFASGLRSVLAPEDEDYGGIFVRLSFAAAVTLVAINAAKSGFWLVLSHNSVRSSASDELVTALAAFETVLLTTAVAWGVAVFLLGASTVMLRSGVFARWLGWLGVSSAILLVSGSLWPVTDNEQGLLGFLVLIGFVGWLAWMTGVAIALVRDRAMAPA